MFKALKQLIGRDRPGLSSAFVGPGALRRVANTPLLTTPDNARVYLGYLMQRHGLKSSLSAPKASDDDDIGGAAAETNLIYQRLPGQSFHNAGQGIAVIPVEGTLVHKLGSMDAYCGMTGYDGLQRKLMDAMADSSIRGVLWDFHSGGGEVSGCAGLAAMIAEAGQTKPQWAMADEAAYSAAYWLASSCNRVIATSTAGTGSIGVVIMHADFSKHLDEQGVKVTLIHGGAHKVDGNPYEVLPDEVRADMQREVDELRMMFARAVAAGRNMSVDAVMATEARCLNANESLAAGLIDDIAPAQSVVSKFIASLNGVNAAPTTTPPPVASPAAAQTQEVQDMSTLPTAAAAPATAPAAVAPVVAPAAVAPSAQLDAAAISAQASARIEGIINSDEAKGRDASAKHLAFKTSMTVDEAKALLATMPKADTSSAESPLTAAMAGQKHPILGGGADAGSRAASSGGQSADLNATVIYANFTKHDRGAGR